MEIGAINNIDIKRAGNRYKIDALILKAILIIAILFLVVFVIIPLFFVLMKSLQDSQGNFIGVQNYREFFSRGGAYSSLINSLFVAILSTILSMGIALPFAYFISRTTMRGKTFFRAVALLPLLTPGLLFGMSLELLFGRGGIFKTFIGDIEIYGPVGIVIGMSIANFPHVFLILSIALAITDQRYYDVAASLGTKTNRILKTITLPGIKFGIASAFIVSFTKGITEFGIPKIIGGQYDVLATQIYKQVVGQQNFPVGSVVSIVLLVPAVLAFFVERHVRKNQHSSVTANIVPYRPKFNKHRDRFGLLFNGFVSFVIILMLLTPIVTSFFTFWPYNLSFTLKHYQFSRYTDGGWAAYTNSLIMAFCTATIGTVWVFLCAYVSEKATVNKNLNSLYRWLAMFPMTIPGLVLGLSYIFFFNHPSNPLNFLYGTMAILIVSTVVHYYTVAHLTLTTSLQQSDKEFELVTDSLKVSRFKTLRKVTIPLSLNAILDIWIYYFLAAMTTLSAVIFLYSYNTQLASVAIINMDDAGDFTPAAALASVVVLTCLITRGVHYLVTSKIKSYASRWQGTAK